MKLSSIHAVFALHLPRMVLAFALCALGCKSMSDASDPKLVDGKILDDVKFNGIVRIFFDGGSCTGQHIGEGYLLSAAHCFIVSGSGEQTRIKVKNYQAETVVSLSPNTYDLWLATAVENREMLSGGHSYTIPTPDLVIVRPKSEANIEKVKALNHFSLSKAKLSRGQEGLDIAGYGITGYEPGSTSDGKLRAGTAGVSQIEEHVYTALWRKDLGGVLAGGAQGDSGGPLFSEDQDGHLLLHGVASAITKGTNQAAEVDRVWTLYTKINRPNVMEWITSVTGLAYLSDDATQND